MTLMILNYFMQNQVVLFYYKAFRYTYLNFETQWGQKWQHLVLNAPTFPARKAKV